MMLHSMHEEDSIKLKKVQKLVQHFCGEQCRHKVPKQNIYNFLSIDERLISIGWLIVKRGREKGRRKISLYKSETTNLYKMWCLGQNWEKCHSLYMKKTYGWVYKCISCFYQWHYYQLSFSDLKNRTKSSFIF